MRPNVHLSNNDQQKGHEKETNCRCFDDPMRTCGDLDTMSDVCICADFGIVAAGGRPFPS